MEKVIVNGSDYAIKDITKSNNLLKITYATDKAPASDKVELYTSGGELAATFSGFTTIYKEDDMTVTYSDDGSVYVEPVVEPTPEPVELTDEQKAEIAKMEKIRELESQIAEVDAEFKTLDYIGIKIATGRAMIDDYKPEIEKMTELADKKNELETELAKLKGDE